MAKQRGVVQLSGRVDNLCYYQQKRVVGGLVRRVNLAMSERVKTGSEYERLRTTNTYFGACSMLSAAIFKMLGTRSKYLHYPDRLALLTKRLFTYLLNRISPVDYGEILLTPASGDTIPHLFEDVVKNKMSKYMPSVPLKISEVVLESVVSFIIPSFELESFCSYNKCVGISFLIVDKCYLYGTSRNVETGKFFYPDSGFSVKRSPIIWNKGDGDLTISFDSGIIDDAFTFAFLTALPIVYMTGDRAVTKISGASCRMIGIIPIV